MNKQPENISIAVVTTFPPGRGTLNEYAFHLLRALGNKPEISKLFVLVDELPGGGSYDAAEIHPSMKIIPCWRFGDWRNPLRILRTLRRLRPDAVLFNIQFASFGGDKGSAALGLTTPPLVQAAGFPTGVLLHNIMETVDLEETGFAGNPLWARVIRFFGDITTRLLLRSGYVALTIPKYVEILAKKYGAANVLLAPHGTFEAPPPPRKEREMAARILTFGKFGTYKMVEPLIEACALLRERGYRPELIIAGTDSPNTPGYLQSVHGRYRCYDWIQYTGYVPEEEVPALFQDASLVVFPYTSTTGSSGVLHQAGSYGRAAVLPNIGDLAELITEEGYAGQFFDPADPESLAGAIARLLDDPDYRRQLGHQNYMAASGLLIDDVADWHLLHLERIVQQKERAAAAPEAAIKARARSAQS